ncbi:hypothetical protein PMAYCL1PPCAC_20750 [Pristionchus mayeri]|uniref:Uncharacterized protein n=1 Tax=Pristionchus mayeri TaxID=1317129 RepID=A0AAN5CU56_9BILA|nr:hypothetical protein PMAYCL1PPCAC_20750 [Pristionchus mayeri]
MLSRSSTQPSSNNDHSMEESDGEDEPSIKKLKSESDEIRDKEVEVDVESSNDSESGKAEEDDEKEKDKTDKQGDEPSLESRLISIVLEVCNIVKTVKSVMQKMDVMTKKMTGTRMARVFCKALLKLPQLDTWHVMRNKMLANADQIDIYKVVPESERNMFKILEAIQKIERFSGLCDSFYREVSMTGGKSLNSTLVVFSTNKAHRLSADPLCTCFAILKRKDLRR